MRAGADGCSSDVCEEQPPEGDQSQVILDVPDIVFLFKLVPGWA